MATGNASFDTLVSTTIDLRLPDVVDNAFSSKPWLWILQNAGKIKNKSGGTSCLIPLLYAESKNHGSYSGRETFASDVDDELTMAQYDWKQYYGLITIDGITEAKNSGKEALIDILDTRMEVLRMTISEHLDRMFLGDGSGNSGKDFLGLKAIVSASDPSVGSLGGIPVATNDWWTSTVEATAEAFSAWGLAGMATAFNSASEGNDHPTNILTTQAVFEAFEASQTSIQRSMDPEVLDAGFQNLLYKGVPLVFDKYVDAGYMYFVNTKYIDFFTLANTWFEPSEIFRPGNQDALYKNVLLYGQMTTSNRSRHSVKTGLTDT